MTNIKKIREIMLCQVIVLSIALLGLFCISQRADACATDPLAVNAGKHMKCVSETGELVKLSDIPYTKSSEKKGLINMEEAGEFVNRSLPTVVIVAGFNNMPYDNSIDWNSEFFSGERSLRGYFLDQSFGKFTFEPATETSKYNFGGNTNNADKVDDGVVHVNLDMDHLNWGSDRHNNAVSMETMLVRAMNQAGEYIDYASYDTNKDGAIEAKELAVTIIVAGYANEIGGHSHSSDLYYHACSGYPDQSTVTNTYNIRRCATMAEYREIGSGQVAPNKYSTMCHELGHSLGIRDMYDTKGTGPWNGYDPRYLSLMSMGNHSVDKNGDPCPSSFDPWSKIKLEWATATTITAPGTYNTRAVNYNNLAAGATYYKIPIQGKEYYLIENRQFEKWDEGFSRMGYGSQAGFLFWHIDDAFSGQQANNADHRPGNCPLYPETDSNGYVTFIGTRPQPYRAFFNKQSWTDTFKPYLSNFLHFPKFVGEGGPETRQLSDKRIEILSDSASEMSFRIPDESEHDHVFKIIRKNEIPANCEAAGSYDEEKVCVTCGETFGTVSKTIGKLGHNKIIVPKVSETCEEDGVRRHYECTRCGKWYHRNYINQEVTPESQIRPATGHSAGSPVRENSTPATCDSPASYDSVVKCVTCDKELSREKKNSGNPLGHSWASSTVKKEPTCSEEGVIEFTCFNDSSHKLEGSIEKVSHTPGDKVAENIVDAKCGAAGSFDEVVHCTVCNEELERSQQPIPAKIHISAAPVTENIVNTTCENPGRYDSVFYCTYCDTELSRVTTTIAAMGHSWDQGKITTDPTCTSEGIKTFECVNDSSHKKSEQVPKTLHVPGNPVKENEIHATCTQPGTYDEVTRCTSCSAELATIPITIPSKGHKLGEPIRDNDVPATCENDGSYDMVTSCTACKDEVDRETIVVKATGHNWDEGKTIKNATCMEEGTKIFTCSKDPSHKKEEKITKRPHSPGDVVTENEMPSTCESEGSYDEVCHCEVCNYEISKETVTTKPTGHLPGVPVMEDAVDPTCTDAGSYRMVSRCSHCEIEMQAESIAVSPVGHTWDEWRSLDKESHIRTCVHDAGHMEKEPHDWKLKERVMIKCPGGGGLEVFSCTKCSEEMTKPIPSNPGNISLIDERILNSTSDSDVKGSRFSPVMFKSSKQSFKKITLTWKSIKGAKKYFLYGNKCGTKNKYKRLAIIPDSKKSFNVSKINTNKLKKGTYYKFVILAVDIKGNVKHISKTIHVATKGGKITNHKKISILAKRGKKWGSVKSVKVKISKKLKLKTALTKQYKKKKAKRHVDIRYESSDPSIATVSKTGQIKGKKKGNCIIFAYAQSGVYKGVKVKVVR